jgi:hypothetical protein
MLDLSNHVLSITYLILWAAVFGRQTCLPVPANLFLLTGGAARATVAAISDRFDLGFRYVLFPTSAINGFLPVGFVHLRRTVQTPSPLSRHGTGAAERFEQIGINRGSADLLFVHAATPGDVLYIDQLPQTLLLRRSSPTEPLHHFCQLQ